MEMSIIYTIIWCVFCMGAGLSFGLWLGAHLKDIAIFKKSFEEFFNKRLAKKTNVLYLSKYKKQR